jgi:hypothetical protein
MQAIIPPPVKADRGYLGHQVRGRHIAHYTNNPAGSCLRGRSQGRSWCDRPVCADCLTKTARYVWFPHETVIAFEEQKRRLHLGKGRSMRGKSRKAMPKKDKKKIKEVIDAFDGTKNTPGPPDQRKWAQSRGNRVPERMASTRQPSLTLQPCTQVEMSWCQIP